MCNRGPNSWLQVLHLIGIDARQLRTDLRQADQDQLLKDFNEDPDAATVLLCSYMVSCAGLNMQKLYRTTVEYEPPPNEAIRQQEFGRLRRRGQPSPWIRHISLLTKDTFNAKQDKDTILQSLPNLLTQLNMEVWGSKSEDQASEDYVLGDFVLREGELFPAQDDAITGLDLDVLSADDLLYNITMRILGRKPEGNVEEL